MNRPIRPLRFAALCLTILGGLLVGCQQPQTPPPVVNPTPNPTPNPDPTPTPDPTPIPNPDPTPNPPPVTGDCVSSWLGAGNLNVWRDVQGGTTSYSYEKVLGTQTFQGASYWAVESGTSTDARGTRGDNYTVVYYTRSGDALTPVKAQSFDASGNVTANTTYAASAPIQGRVAPGASGNYTIVATTETVPVMGISTRTVSNVSTTYQVGARETVTVAAGTFNACALRFNPVTVDVSTTVSGPFPIPAINLNCTVTGTVLVGPVGNVTNRDYTSQCTGGVPGEQVNTGQFLPASGELVYAVSGGVTYPRP